VKRVDGFYLYQVGSQIHPLSELRAYAFPGAHATTVGEALGALYIAEAALEGLVHRSIFRLKMSVGSGQTLLNLVRALKAKLADEQNAERPLGWPDIYPITSALTNFEAVLGAELGLMPLYVVTAKGGFDTSVLIESGANCFPSELMFKVPEAIPDFTQGTKCIAFELFTAAGFHLHRGNEAVLRRYWGAVTGGAPQPTTLNMGDFLNQMDQLGVGDPNVKAALKDLKNLHRNPLIHPEHSLETADEAIALMNGVHTVTVYMLKEIPVVTAIPEANQPGAIAPPESATSPLAALFSEKPA
jgi:hypothetical protein